MDVQELYCSLPMDWGQGRRVTAIAAVQKTETGWKALLLLKRVAAIVDGPIHKSVLLPYQAFELTKNETPEEVAGLLALYAVRDSVRRFQEQSG